MKLLVLLLGFCCFEAQAQCVYYQGVCQADWMKNLSSIIKQRPLTQIRLPGTHDSSAYQLNLTATTPMEVTTAFDWFKKQAPSYPIISRLLLMLTLAQPLSIIDQLEQGIRAFDFRILYNKDLKEFFLSHSFATVSLDTVLTQIRFFLSKHLGEFLIITMETDSEHVTQTTPYVHAAINQVLSILGKYLIPVTLDKKLNAAMTLENLVNINQRVLFIFTDWKQSHYAHVWPSGVFVEYWPNGQNVSESMSKISEYLPQLETPQSQYLNSVFFTVTPTQNSVIAGVIGGPVFGCKDPRSLFDWANLMNPVALDFIDSNLTHLSGLNVVRADAPSDEYVQRVISLNEQV
ncbi:MAG: phosphatidylinositol-specific phospholipase C domain-containing protein [Myxococcaceae bacterium]